MSIVERLNQQLGEHPILPFLRGLFQIAVASHMPDLSPYAAALDAVAVELYQQHTERRVSLLLDELAKGKLNYSDERIQSLEFVHRFDAVFRAALSSDSEEKIRLFARLLSAAARGEPATDLSSQFDEYLGILLELSPRELGILVTLAEFEQQYPLRDGEYAVQRAGRFWDEFMNTLCRRLAVPQEEVASILLRLTRTAAYDISGTLVGLGFDQQRKGNLTALYYHLARWVRMNEVVRVGSQD